ncbi:DUF2231 domain-containing protein [Lentzea sp. HUAS TT2]|uniref:DUF2231 domain-containing protein n=1 Tax=Lentzea sp. HUAS TT2 TaxID=3447454 RepID=UPI003F707F17
MSLVLDFVSRTAADPTPYVRGATSSIGWGLLAAGAAVVAGFVDSMSIPARTKAFRSAMVHFGLMTAAFITFLTGYVLRKAEPLDRPVEVQTLAVSLIGVVLVLGGAVNGVLLAHRRA